MRAGHREGAYMSDYLFFRADTTKIIGRLKSEFSNIYE